jgi:riboflavin kinase/FMN adenylyltransferase
LTDFSALYGLADWAEKFGGERQGRQAVLSVGNFDGMHLGHRKILRRVVERARATKSLAAVVTFDPHPLKVLRPGLAPPLVETLGQRLGHFEDVGLDAALVLRFDEALARLSPEEFAGGILGARLQASAILVGQNFRFGYRQAGDVSLLQEIGSQLGFSVEILTPVIVDGQVVSSSAVRSAVGAGSVAEAARLLGRPFALAGEIHRGTGRGSEIVVPTLNLKTEQELLPKTGVYATEVQVAGKLYRSATNVGLRPTFDGNHLTIESHLFNFKDRLTAGPLEVRFWERLRDEKKFAGPDQLLRQIAADIEQAREFFDRLDSTPPIPQPA